MVTVRAMSICDDHQLWVFFSVQIVSLEKNPILILLGLTWVFPSNCMLAIFILWSHLLLLLLESSRCRNSIWLKRWMCSATLISLASCCDLLFLIHLGSARLVKNDRAEECLALARLKGLLRWGTVKFLRGIQATQLSTRAFISLVVCCVRLVRILEFKLLWVLGFSKIILKCVEWIALHRGWWRVGCDTVKGLRLLS
jgi:hypothetical protein